MSSTQPLPGRRWWLSRRNIVAWAALVVVLALGSAARRSEEGRAFRRFLHARTLDRSLFPSGDAVGILTRLGHLHPVPDDPRLRPDQRPRFGSYRLGVDPIPENEVVSTLLLDRAKLDGTLPVVSLLTDSERLKWLHENRLGRGKEFEIPAFFALIEQGKVSFSSKVDLRLHGGWTRRIPAVSSYRVYFRRSNGSLGFPASLLPGYEGPDPRRLILRFNGAADPFGREWHFTGPLAYDLARQAGVPAPFTRPVLFFVNGEYRGVRALTEHLSAATFEAKLGHDRFVLVDTKPSFQRAPLTKHGDPQRFDEMSRNLMATPVMTAERAAQDIDLDNLSRWWAVVLFCATEDRFQGPLVLDTTSPTNRWYLTAWDIDLSFGRGYPPEVSWQQIDTLQSVFQRRELRSELLWRLFDDGRTFHAPFAKIFDEVMNHRLTAEFLAERSRYYAGLVEAAGLPLEAGERLLAVAEHAEERQLQVRRHLDFYWHFGQSFPVRVEARPGQVYRVDGFEKHDPYRGWYFTGQTIHLEIPGRSTLQVNGQNHPTPDGVLEMVVDRELVITLP